MKKAYYFLLTILLVTVSCTKDESGTIHSTDYTVFEAYFAEQETKTYVDENLFLFWHNGDQLSIFNHTTLNEQYQFTGETGMTGGAFERIGPNGFVSGSAVSTNYGVYPYKETTNLINGGIVVYLPSEQEYAEKSFGRGANTMVAVTSGPDDTFLPFKNIGGYLRLRLYGNDVTIKSIKLKGNNNDKIAGKATITASHSTNPTISMSDEATTSITLDCGEGVDLSADSENPTEFWIVVPPITFERGFTITITDTEGRIMTKSASNEFTVERNTIKSMAAFDVICVEPTFITYTTNDGNALTINSDKFDAPILSHTYENGEGVITFSGAVTQIRSKAFFGCSSLTSISLPESLTSIGESAFSGCSSIASIVIPEGVTKLGDSAFLYRMFTLTHQDLLH